MDDLGGDLQVELIAQAMVLDLQGNWPAMAVELAVHRFERPSMWGPTMAGRLARPYLEPPNAQASCHKGTPDHEAVLVNVAGLVHWSDMAHDPFGSLSKFFGYALTGLDDRLGYGDVPTLIGAALSYVPDLATGDMYRVALRASKAIVDRVDVSGVILSAWTAFQVWPLFFSKLTLKRALI